MSCPTLSLHIASAATPSDVTEFLCVNGSLVNLPIESRTPLSHVGAIEISLRPPWVQEPHYGAAWRYAVDFDSTYHWAPLRDLLALQLCEHLYSKRGGMFLAAYDTGAVAFYLREGELVLPKEELQYFSKYPLPFETFRFEDLPTV